MGTRGKSGHAYLVQAMVKAGAGYCPECRSYVAATHDIEACQGVPLVSLRWDWAYTGRLGDVRPHHDPIDRDWNELEAEAINQEGEAA